MSRSRCLPDFYHSQALPPAKISSLQKIALLENARHPCTHNRTMAQYIDGMGEAQSGIDLLFHSQNLATGVAVHRRYLAAGFPVVTCLAADTAGNTTGLAAGFILEAPNAHPYLPGPVQSENWRGPSSREVALCAQSRNC